MLWARMARASRAVVARERAWPPNFCYRKADSALENCLSTGCPVGQWQDMSKGKQLREGLTGACSWYAVGDHKVPHSSWMVGCPKLMFGRFVSAEVIADSQMTTQLMSLPRW